MPHGALDQYKIALEQLATKLTGGHNAQKIGRAVAWKFDKVELDGILKSIARLKSLIRIALQNDHL